MFIASVIYLMSLGFFFTPPVPALSPLDCKSVVKLYQFSTQKIPVEQVKRSHERLLTKTADFFIEQDPKLKKKTPLKTEMKDLLKEEQKNIFEESQCSGLENWYRRNTRDAFPYTLFLKSLLRATDPHSTYFTEKEYASFSQTLENPASNDTVKCKILRPENHRIAYLRVSEFYGSTDPFSNNHRVSEDFYSALKSCTCRKTDAVVLDLRNNPGGFLEEAVRIGSLFVGKKAIVQVRENKEKMTLHGYWEKPVYTGPLYILVDEESASASEVLAAALQDHKRAVILGDKRTFGKGTVQKLFRPADEPELLQNFPRLSGMLKVTTSVYLTPKGRCINHKGLKADFPLKAESIPTYMQDILYVAKNTPISSEAELAAE